MNKEVKQITVNDFEVIIEKQVIEKQVKEIQTYFKNRLLTQNFEIVEIEVYTTKINIDGYFFWIWTANIDIVETIKTTQASLIKLDFSEKEQEKLQYYLKPIIKKHRKEVLIKQKEAELKKLKNES